MHHPRLLTSILAVALMATAASFNATATHAQGLIFDWGGEKTADSGKQHIKFGAGGKPGDIIVSFGDRKLYHVVAPGEADTYPIAIPREQSRWEGITTVSMKRENPSWTPTAHMLQENPRLPRWVPGGHPMNPLGNRALYLGSSDYRIHGTDAPWTIGTPASKGCVRMFNKDVADLYPRVKVGAKVTVTWQKYDSKVAGAVDVPITAVATGKVAVGSGKATLGASSQADDEGITPLPKITGAGSNENRPSEGMVSKGKGRKAADSDDATVEPSEKVATAPSEDAPVKRRRSKSAEQAEPTLDSKDKDSSNKPSDKPVVASNGEDKSQVSDESRDPPARRQKSKVKSEPKVETGSIAPTGDKPTSDRAQGERATGKAAPSKADAAKSESAAVAIAERALAAAERAALAAERAAAAAERAVAASEHRQSASGQSSVAAVPVAAPPAEPAATPPTAEVVAH